MSEKKNLRNFYQYKAIIELFLIQQEEKVYMIYIYIRLLSFFLVPHWYALQHMRHNTNIFRISDAN